jgi:hypothetical protein
MPVIERFMDHLHARRREVGEESNWPDIADSTDAPMTASQAQPTPQESVALVSAFRSIRDARRRARVIRLVERLAEQERKPIGE